MIGLIEVGAQGGADDLVEGEQDAILVEAGYGFQRPAERPPNCRDLGFAVRATGSHQLLQVVPENLVFFQAAAHQGTETAFQLAARLLRAALVRDFAIRVEHGLEQLDQQRRDRRMPRQGLAHIAGREGYAGLQQVLAVGPQDLHLPPVHPRGNDQLVEAVAVRLAPQGPQERLLESVANALEIEVPLHPGHHVEILDPETFLVRKHQFVGPLADDVQAQVLEHGQNVRQRNRCVLAEKLEPENAPAPLAWSVQAHSQRFAVVDGSGVFHVERRHPGGDVLLVGLGERLAESRRETQTGFLAQLFDEDIAQFVGPGPYRFDDLLLERSHVEFRRSTRLRAHDHVQPGQMRFRNHDRVVQTLALQRLAQDSLHGLAVLGVELFPGQIHDAGVETAVTLPADEQADALAFLQVEDADRDVPQFQGRGLQQFVTGQRFQDVQHGFPGMAAGHEAALLQNFPDPHAGHRRFHRCNVVGRRGEQSQKSSFGDRSAPPVELQDPYIVQVAGSMNGGPGIRLGDDQRDRLPLLPRHLRQAGQRP